MNGNRLGSEASPYLLLHARNPVDWYPWGEAAFAAARAQQKPIFLSIGYYTCHWCHVMERESFADAEIGALLRQHFIAIKVDREERPDVDRIYMAFVQATTGGGGWPLSAFLTPALKPFFGGTYFPPRDRHSHPSFRRVLLSIAEAWHNQRDNVMATGDEITAALEKAASGGAGRGGFDWDREGGAIARRLYDAYAQSFDHHDGGFGGAPKFPRPATLDFLFRFAREQGKTRAAAAAHPGATMALATLRAMAMGGIHDHIGGGFHRYATDAGWRVPHFEKMLYDQAQLVVTYIEAWRLSGAPEWERVARSILDFVLAEMTTDEGGFYSAQDADSAVPAGHGAAGTDPGEAAEGAYYLWLAAEIDDLLDVPTALRVGAEFHLRDGGNVPSQLDPQGEFGGKNILYRTGDGEAADAEWWRQARPRLYAARAQRPHPPTDDKVLTAWNGLMISAFAQAAAAWNDARYLAAAQSAARFIAKGMTAGAALLRRWRQGEAAIAGFVEDYAFLIRALLDLYQADFDPHWLDWARALQTRQDGLFWDAEGGYFAAAADPSLLLRLREDYDGAEPSANSVAFENLMRLALIFDDDGLRQRARQLLAGFGERLRQHPEALPLLVAKAMQAAHSVGLAVVVGNRQAEATQSLLTVLRRRPDICVLLADGSERQRQLALALPFLAEFHAPPRGAAVYLCENYTCRLPISAAGELNAVLDPE